MASLVLFLCFSFFMFQAGYQWRKWAGKAGQGRPVTVDDREAVRSKMVGKL